MNAGAARISGLWRGGRFDKAGTVFALLLFAAIIFQPFFLVRPNRIAAAVPVTISGALPAPWAWTLIGFLTIVGLILIKGSPATRLIASTGALLAVAVATGLGASALVPAGNTYARVSPGGCVWLSLFILSLAASDALTRTFPSPLARPVALVTTLVVGFSMLAAGLWDDLSMLREYEIRKQAFTDALVTHMLLAPGALVAAMALAAPVAIFLHRKKPARNAATASLGILQTIPSMALFGLLIAPLAWAAAHIPGASSLGIAGIGPAPAFLALTGYSLLPVFNATITGLDAVPRTVLDAADGMGMTRWQRLRSVELPLALPFLMAGIRFTLVQNIGLATIAALVGGGGLGVFVFQGISQTATDLVLLGAVPVVVMAFSAAAILDILISIINGHVTGEKVR